MLLGLISDLLQRRQNRCHTVSLCEWFHCLPDHRSQHSAAIGTPHCESGRGGCHEQNRRVESARFLRSLRRGKELYA